MKQLANRRRRRLHTNQHTERTKVHNEMHATEYAQARQKLDLQNQSYTGTQTKNETHRSSLTFDICDKNKNERMIDKIIQLFHFIECFKHHFDESVSLCEHFFINYLFFCFISRANTSNDTKQNR